MKNKKTGKDQNDPVTGTFQGRTAPDGSAGGKIGEPVGTIAGSLGETEKPAAPAQGAGWPVRWSAVWPWGQRPR